MLYSLRPIVRIRWVLCISRPWRALVCLRCLFERSQFGLQSFIFLQQQLWIWQGLQADTVGVHTTRAPPVLSNNTCTGSSNTGNIMLGVKDCKESHRK